MLNFTVNRLEIWQVITPDQSDEVYQKTINITQVYKIVPIEIRGKIKLGQHLPQERFEMILEHLSTRGSEIDKLTVEEMKKAKTNNY